MKYVCTPVAAESSDEDEREDDDDRKMGEEEKEDDSSSDDDSRMGEDEEEEDDSRVGENEEDDYSGDGEKAVVKRRKGGDGNPSYRVRRFQQETGSGRKTALKIAESTPISKLQVSSQDVMDLTVTDVVSFFFLNCFYNMDVSILWFVLYFSRRFLQLSLELSL